MIGESLGGVGLSSSIGLKLSGGVCVGGMIGSGASGVIGPSVGPDGITVSGWLASLRVKKEPAFWKWLLAFIITPVPKPAPANAKFPRC